MIKQVAIGFLWIIHLSAIIGIALGYETFFFPKSPFTMVYIMFMMVWWFPVNKIYTIGLFFICFAIGMLTEWIGIHTAWLFGDYRYLNNLGIKLDGVPLLIGVNWGILVFITHILAGHYYKNKWLRAMLGATLMVIMDYFLEQICAHAGFWEFTNGAGWYNYICWFAIGYVLQLLASRFQLQGDKRVALNLYLVQTLFAAILWILITI